MPLVISDGYMTSCQERNRGLNHAASCFPIPFLPLSRSRVQAGQVLSQPRPVPLIGTRCPDGGQELLGAALSHLVRVLPQRPLGCLSITITAAPITILIPEAIKQGTTTTCFGPYSLHAHYSTATQPPFRYIMPRDCPHRSVDSSAVGSNEEDPDSLSQD